MSFPLIKCSMWFGMSPDLPPIALPIGSAAKEGLCLLTEVRRHFGSDVAEFVWSKLANRRFYIPRSVAPDHELARILGTERANVIASSLGGITVELPAGRGLKHRRVIRLRRSGKTVPQIVKASGYSERYIYMILKQARAVGLLPTRHSARRKP